MRYGHKRYRPDLPRTLPYHPDIIVARHPKVKERRKKLDPEKGKLMVTTDHRNLLRLQEYEGALARLVASDNEETFLDEVEACMRLYRKFHPEETKS